MANIAGAMKKDMEKLNKLKNEQTGSNSALSDVLCKLEIALDDAITLHAPEFCSKQSVYRTRKRISEAGGTLAYFANLKAEIKKFA